MNKSFLQTTEWLEFQKATGHKTWRFDSPTGGGKITANIIKLGLPFGKSFLYIPHGPEINFEHIGGGLKNELEGFLRYLGDLARKEGSIFVKFEPMSDIVAELVFHKKIRRSSKQIQPYKTVLLDLSVPEENLFEKLHPKTRYNIRVAEKHGIQVGLSQDVDAFWNLMQKTTERDKFSSHPKEYYQKLLESFNNDEKVKTELFLATSEGQPVAGAIVLRFGDTGYYLHGASDYNHRALMAPYSLHWEIIKKLRFEGYKYYDFWGIDAKKWPGVTRFKMGWLGSPKSDEGGAGLKESPGSFDMPVSRVWYLVYSLARKIF